MKKRICLLYLITAYDIGGAEKAMVRILSRLDRNKYDITVAALKIGSGLLLNELKRIEIRTETLYVSGTFDIIHAAVRLSNLIKRYNTEVLICSLFHATILGRLIGKLAKIPVIVNWQHSERLGGAHQIFLNKITTHCVDKIICDSKKVEAEIRRALSIPEYVIETIPIGGVDLGEYYYQKRNVSSNITVGSVGNLLEAKGYQYLIEAARIILKKKIILISL
jgi:glycosyltransferase involved in cell wall biosynthesis